MVTSSVFDQCSYHSNSLEKVLCRTKIPTFLQSDLLDTPGFPAEYMIGQCMAMQIDAMNACKCAAIYVVILSYTDVCMYLCAYVHTCNYAYMYASCA